MRVLPLNGPRHSANNLQDMVNVLSIHEKLKMKEPSTITSVWSEPFHPSWMPESGSTQGDYNPEFSVQAFLIELMEMADRIMVVIIRHFT